MDPHSGTLFAQVVQVLQDEAVAPFKAVGQNACEEEDLAWNFIGVSPGVASVSGNAGKRGKRGILTEIRCRHRISSSIS